MKMRVKAVPMMKSSCLPLPPYMSRLDTWTPKVRFRDVGGSLAVPERAQGRGAQRPAFLEAWEKMSRRRSSSGTSCLENPEVNMVAPRCPGAFIAYRPTLSYMEQHLLQ